MSRVGIVAEFNPLHTGHKYIIDYAKNNLGADSVVIALGNEFTQRGGIAIIDRYSRAQSAIDAGADLVIGMPVLPSCASAEIFAESGVALLAACGCDKIVCGYEGISSENLLNELACVLVEEPDQFKEELHHCLKSGMSFPAARGEALSACFPDCKNEIDYFLKEPNNILALEYQKAIIRCAPSIELVPVKRQGAGHHDMTAENGYASASYIRETIQAGRLNDIRPQLTEASYKILKDASVNNLLLFDDDLSLPLHLELLSINSYNRFFDVTEDFSDRIKKLLPEYVSFSQFADLLKNKSLTASRIRRCLIHILLGITEDDANALRCTHFAPYLWVLSASKGGLSMLGDIKSSSNLPLFFSINEKAAEEAVPFLQPELKALRIARALRIEKSRLSLPNENQRKINLN
jgi:predicted nucleotidyltransferase